VSSILRTGIIGAGGHGRVVREIVELQAGLEPVAFYDDDPLKWGQVIDGTPVSGAIGELRGGPRPVDAVVVAIGLNNTLRARFFEEMSGLGYEMASAIHPYSSVSKATSIGRGFVGMAGIIINPGTEIGENVCVNTGASVDHDCRLEDHCMIFPNASIAGGVRVGRLACVCQNASVNQYLTVAARSIVGAGAVVTENIPEGVVAVGAPARVIRSINDAPENGP